MMWFKFYGLSSEVIISQIKSAQSDTAVRRPFVFWQKDLMIKCSQTGGYPPTVLLHGIIRVNGLSVWGYYIIGGLFTKVFYSTASSSGLFLLKLQQKSTATAVLEWLPCPAWTNGIVSRVTLPLAVPVFFCSYSRKKPTAAPNPVRFFRHQRRFSAFATDFAIQC